MSETDTNVVFSAKGLLRALRERGVRLSADGDRLRAEAPAGALGADMQSAIRQLKAELIDLLATEDAAGSSASLNGRTHVRLSPPQERLWIFQQLDPESTAYHLAPFIRIEGELDVVRFEQALTRTIERHEPLRSVVGDEHPGGVIRALPMPKDLLAHADLSHLTGDAQADALRELMQRQQLEPFDLRTDLPIRATLVRLGPSRHGFVTTMHHIAVDGVSVRVFYRDLAAYYDGTEPQPLRATYSDYAAWQREYWTAAAIERRADYWRETLRDAPTVLDMPSDTIRAGRPTYSGGLVSARLDASTHRSLMSLVQSERASLFMVVLAAFGAALHRHSGQRDIIIGAPLHGRDRTEFGELVGMFVNQLPLRIRIPRDTTLRELVRSTRDMVLGSMSSAEMPFAELVEALDNPRDPSRTPLFQAMLNVLPRADVATGLRAGAVTFQLPDMQEQLTMFDGQSKLDFTLYAIQGSNELDLVLIYNRDLYSTERMSSLIDSVRDALACVATPDEPMDRLLTADAVDASLVTERPAGSVGRLCAIREQLDVTHSAAGSAAAMFDEVAIRFADRPAIVTRSAVTTYAELAVDVERVARLVATAVAPGETIGMFVPHDSSIPAALLGALRAGRPYVPMDPRYPRERLAFMLDDASVSAVLTTRALRDTCEALVPIGTKIVVLEDDADGPLPPMPAGDTIAYVLYTSGSTSTPKAVVQSQHNLVRQAGRYAAALSLTPADRLALLASISFDASVMDLYGALLTGAAIAPIDLRETDLAVVPGIVTDLGLTVLHTTPTVFRTLGSVAGQRGMPSVRAVDLGGERVRVDDVALFDQLFEPNAILMNSYGPSEHTLALGHIIDRSQRSIEVPIGVPLDDVDVLLLDEDGHEDPVVGEMVLRSRYGALGYWNRPELTAHAFLPDPADAHRTMYRTGDIVRRRPDGMYVYLHRADHQLKIRGYRIEPQEVEAVLARHANVREVAVHGPAGTDGNPVLTACIAWKQGSTVSVRDIAAWCGDQLPGFMVPTEWLTVDALPRTPTGKIDRKALPAASVSGPSDSVSARDAIEYEVRQIWSDVLRRDGIGVDEDFFTIGGQSLMAMQVVARVRDVFNVDLPLRQFFEHATITDTAGWIRKQGSASSSMPPLVPTAAQDSVPLSFSQERLWFLQQLDSGASAYNMCIASLLGGPFDVERFRHAVEVVACRQASLRTRFIARSGQPRQVVDAEPNHAFIVEDVSMRAESERLDAATALVAEHTQRVYDLENGPLFRMMVVRLDDQRHLVGVGMHHTISDLVSFGVFARELRTAYEGARFEELPVSYRDFSVWQRDWLRGDVVEREVGYWREQLAGVKPLEIATDFPRPQFQSFDGDSVHIALPAPLRERIARFAAENRVTPFMTMLAAFNALLSTYSGQTDIAVGVPIAGRTTTAVQNLIGAFVNTLVHRNDLSGDPSFRDLVARVRATALGAYAHQDAPFELLVRELQPPRDTSRSPFFQVLFNVANIRADGVGLDGVMHTYVPLRRDAAQFDLTLSIGLNEVQSDIQLAYNTNLFTRSTAERLAEHYREVLDRAVSDPDGQLSALCAPTRSDARLLRDDWNDTSREYPWRGSVTSLIAASAQNHPDTIAVQSPTGSWTYAELLEYSQRVATALRQLGVMPGDRVAIVMQRSREMLGALTGILAAGATYVPIDPNYPAARVAYMLDDSKAAAIVCHRGLERAFDIAVPVLDLDTWTPPRSGESFAEVVGDDAAYVIYTSGSTGQPKGVEVTHRGMVNFLNAMIEQPGAGPDDVLVAVTTISFDIAVLELFLPLVAGGRVVIAGEDDAVDGRRLMRLIDESGATLVQATPATWKLLIASGWQGSANLRALCGGEPLPRALADQLLDRVSELWNMYGPTETTVWSTIDRVQRDAPILIGRPIANTTIYVLGEDRSLKPIGVPGELYIGGAGVAAGYVNRPDLTADRFVESPFIKGERLYRTGDLVRYHADGRLEHLGRLDNQVKVRGFRIELGEVEAALMTHAAVRDAVATATGDRLLAYAVLASDRHVTTTELRDWMRTTLPPYMVPSMVIPLDALPLTPNGKVDRRLLPDPAGTVDAIADWVEPVGDAAETIAEIWSELLGIERIGMHDRFFEIGGHSLLAMQAVAMIEERTGHRPEPRSLFLMTLGEIAAAIPQPVPAQ